MDYHASNIRNIAFIGHGGDGKTSLTEALLFLNGNIDRLGKTEEGNTVSDYDQEEVKRKNEQEEREKQMAAWRASGKCQHCGGALKGLFSKKCVMCGKLKDY